MRSPFAVRYSGNRKTCPSSCSFMSAKAMSAWHSHHLTHFCAVNSNSSATNACRRSRASHLIMKDEDSHTPPTMRHKHKAWALPNSATLVAASQSDPAESEVKPIWQGESVFTWPRKSSATTPMSLSQTSNRRLGTLLTMAASISSAENTNASFQSGSSVSNRTCVCSLRDASRTTVYGSDRPLLSAARSPRAQITCSGASLPGKPLLDNRSVQVHGEQCSKLMGQLSYAL